MGDRLVVDKSVHLEVVKNPFNGCKGGGFIAVYVLGIFNNVGNIALYAAGRPNKLALFYGVVKPFGLIFIRPHDQAQVNLYFPWIPILHAEPSPSK